MNDALMTVCARVDSATGEEEEFFAADAQHQFLWDAQALLAEVVRLQDWLTAMMAQGQRGPPGVEVPPANLLKLLEREDIYREAAHLGFQELAQWCTEALMDQPAPDVIVVDVVKSTLKLSAWQRLKDWLTSGGSK